MPNVKTESAEKNSVSLRFGRWFEARGTGWGVLAIPLVLLVLALLAGALHAHGFGS